MSTATLATRLEKPHIYMDRRTKRWQVAPRDGGIRSVSEASRFVQALNVKREVAAIMEYFDGHS